MKYIVCILLFIASNTYSKILQAQEPVLNISTIAQQLLLAAKKQEPTDSLANILKNISEGELQKQLKSDDEKKAFWINVYNAYTQILLSKNPDKYKHRSSFFGSKQIEIAGYQLSLDKIEHGILRHSKTKWSFGYINKWFPSSFEKKNRVNTLDYRLHFCLNCGATSCPPIAFYKAETLNKQMDIATKTYLKSECEYKEEENAVYVPTLMSWFRADFGGKKKVLQLLKNLEVVTADKSPTIKYKKYNWNLFLDNYKKE